MQEKTPRLENALLSRKEAARILGYSAATLRRWAAMPDQNGLPVIKFPGGMIRYSIEDLIAWIASHRRDVGSL